MGNERTMRASMQHRDVQQDSAFAIGHLFAVMHLPGLGNLEPDKQRFPNPTFGDGSSTTSGDWGQTFLYPGGDSNGKGKAATPNAKVRTFDDHTLALTQVFEPN